MLGYSPQSERMNVPWYKWLLTWMHDLRKDEISQLDSTMANIKAKRENIGAAMSSWLPSW